MVKLTFEQLRKTSQARQVHCYADQPSPDFDYAVGAAGCIGNILKLLRQDFVEGETSRHSQVAEEIADAVIFLDLFAASLAFSLDSLITAKFNADAQALGSSDMIVLDVPE